MACKNCLFTRNCENYDAVKCKDCERYENGVSIGRSLLPESACFKCKYENACLANPKEKSS
jgi:hypothetical protein